MMNKKWMKRKVGSKRERKIGGKKEDMYGPYEVRTRDFGVSNISTKGLADEIKFGTGVAHTHTLTN